MVPECVQQAEQKDAGLIGALKAVWEPTRELIVGLMLLPAALVAVAIGPKLGIYDGKTFKVIEDFRIVRREATDDGHIKLTATFTKARSCKPLDGFKEIFIDVGSGYYTPFHFTTDKPLEVRPVGSWPVVMIIDAPAAYKDEKMKLFAHHDCYGGWLWTTVTPVLDQSTDLGE